MFNKGCGDGCFYGMGFSDFKTVTYGAFRPKAKQISLK